MFKKLVAVDHTGLEPWAEEAISKMAESYHFYKDDPADVAETILRAKDADGLLVSWRTPITKEILSACPSVKYIGMCCSLYDEKSANVDISFAKERGIVVRGVKNYGDEGLVEFIFYRLIGLFHGFGEYQWSDKQEELTGKTLGIIGMGATGQMLKDRALAFGMNVIYFSRTRKPEIESPSVVYMPLPELLKNAEIVSTHLPKFSKIMDEDAFRHFGDHKIFINTSLEPTFELEAFEKWIQQPGNFSIMDRSAMGSAFTTLSAFPNVLFTEKVTGFTRQAEKRLSEKVLENLNSLNL